MERQNTITREEALQKMRHFCTYQQRCNSEASEKLDALGMRGMDRAEILEQLLRENYLNEERFALHFSRGRFRIKHWGRVKIKYALQQKKVSKKCIEKALEEIDERTYLQTLKKLAREKLKTLVSEKNSFVRKKRTADYLLQRGFELREIKKMLDALE